jgi:hypothetical protein
VSEQWLSIERIEYFRARWIPHALALTRRHNDNGNGALGSLEIVWHQFGEKQRSEEKLRPEKIHAQLTKLNASIELVIFLILFDLST